MKIYIRILVVFVAVTLLGCSSINPFKRHRKAPEVKFKQASSVAKKDAIGTVVDKELFAKGGNIVVLPFTAGEGVLANDALDKNSLMIIKGIADVIDENKGRQFNIVFSQDAQEADIILEGHIDDKSVSSGIKKFLLFFKPKKVTMGIDARLTVKDTDKLIAVFKCTRTDTGSDMNVLAYTIGHEIGMFLVSR